MKIISELETGVQTATSSGSHAHLASEGFSFDAPTCTQTETCAVRVALLQLKENLSPEEVNLIELFRRATWQQLMAKKSHQISIGLAKIHV